MYVFHIYLIIVFVVFNNIIHTYLYVCKLNISSFNFFFNKTVAVNLGNYNVIKDDVTQQGICQLF